MNATSLLAGLVHIVDDNASLRRAINRLLQSHGFQAETYASAGEFLAATIPETPSCIVLDLQMPEVTGLELQRLLASRKNGMPIIFISGHGDIPATVQAMKAGAVNFLTKPFDETELIASVKAALLQAKENHQEAALERKDREAFERLSERERQVCVCVAKGMLNKQIAAELGTKEKTVKAQRGNLMNKLNADSSADLVRLVERLRASGYPI